MELYCLPQISLFEPEQVEERSKEYIKICAKNNMKPSVAGYALALGIDRGYLWGIVNGKYSTKHPDATLDTLKRFYTFLNAQMEDWMQNGKINPVSGIFLMKNNLGYKDQQEYVLTPNAQNENNAADLLNDVDLLEDAQKE